MIEHHRATSDDENCRPGEIVCEVCREPWPCAVRQAEDERRPGTVFHLAVLFLGAAAGIRNIERMRQNRHPARLTPAETAACFRQGFDEDNRRHGLPSLAELEVLREDDDGT
jgi:hypothetical protein